MTNDDVQAAIARAQAALSEKTGITIERIVSELAAIGFSRITDVVKWTSAEFRFDQDGAGRGPVIFAQPAHFIQLLNSDELSAASAAAISRIGIGKEGEIKIKMHDKLAALVALGKHLGMFKEAEKPIASTGLRAVFEQFGVDYDRSREQFYRLLEDGLSKEKS